MNRSRTVPILDKEDNESGVAIVEQHEDGEGIEAVVCLRLSNGKLSSFEFAADEVELERLNYSLGQHPLMARYFSPVVLVSNHATHE